MRILLIVVLCVSAHAEHAVSKWAAVGACVASATDLAVTAYAAHNGQVIELNPLLRASNGAPSVFKMSLFKSALCAATVYVASRKGTPGAYSFAVSTPASAVFTWATIHDIRQLRKETK